VAMTSLDETPGLRLRPRCQATRLDGEACEAPATADGLCWSHSPALQEKRDAARERGAYLGGMAAKRKWMMRLTGGPLATPKDIVGLAQTVIDEVMAQDLSNSQSHRVVLAAGGLALEAMTHDIEERLLALEEAAGVRRDGVHS